MVQGVLLNQRSYWIDPPKPVCETLSGLAQPELPLPIADKIKGSDENANTYMFSGSFETMIHGKIITENILS